MKKWLYLLLVLVAPAAIASTVSVETTGVGRTLDEAIDSAITRAVEQVSGVSVDSDRKSSKIYVKESGQGSAYRNESNDGTSFKSKGEARYRVLSDNCLKDQCRVRLAVQVEQNDDLERQKKLKEQNKNRRTIAIKPFIGPKGSEMAKKIETLFVQDRKFKVLNDHNAPNLDYILTGKVLKAQTNKRVVDNSRTVELTGEKIKDVKTYINSEVLVEYKIIDVVNNQVKWSAMVPTTSERNNLSLLMQISAKKVFTQLKNNIYPLVVIVANDGSIILNSGGSTLKVGDQFEVFSLGEKIIDPITKESLGYNERKVATVKVKKVLPKLAYVKVVSGDASLIDNQQIARKVVYKAPKRKPKVVKTKSVPVGDGSAGGIIL